MPRRRHPAQAAPATGYDHSYYFISTFMGDHLAWHTERLQAGWKPYIVLPKRNIIVKLDGRYGTTVKQRRFIPLNRNRTSF